MGRLNWSSQIPFDLIHLCICRMSHPKHWSVKQDAKQGFSYKNTQKWLRRDFFPTFFDTYRDTQDNKHLKPRLKIIILGLAAFQSTPQFAEGINYVTLCWTFNTLLHNWMRFKKRYLQKKKMQIGSCPQFVNIVLLQEKKTKVTKQIIKKQKVVFQLDPF